MTSILMVRSSLTKTIKRKDALEKELRRTQAELENANAKIRRLENETLTHLSLARPQTVQSTADQDQNQIYEAYQDALHKIEKQEQLLAQKDHMMETSSNISSDKDIQSHLDQSQVYFSPLVALLSKIFRLNLKCTKKKFEFSKPT